MPVMSSASPFLKTSWTRCAERGVLVRQDIGMMLEGLRLKGSYLQGLRAKIEQHRRDDVDQLAMAQQDVWSRWDERLSRLEEWNASATILRQSSNGLRTWRDNAVWFDDAQAFGQRFAAVLLRKIERLEKKSVDAADRMTQWTARLILKETELREYASRPSEKAAETMMPSARKRLYLDFLFSEREEEGRLALETKSIGAQTSRSLQRLSRVEAQVAKKADENPAHFEIRKNQVFEVWRPLKQRLMQISQRTVNLGLPFEEGRQRLRSIYETVQKVKVIETPPSRRKPLLYRLFNISDD